MKLADRIKELEERIRELEARPMYVPMYIPYPLPSYPPTQVAPWFRQPWYTSQPWSKYGGGYGATTPIGNGPHSVTVGMSEGGIG